MYYLRNRKQFLRSVYVYVVFWTLYIFGIGKKCFRWNHLADPLQYLRGPPGVYFTIGNLEQKYKSQLRHIHLCLLIRYQLCQRYPLKDTLRPLLLDLKQLYTKGIEICVNERSHFLKGALATISADTLSAHNLAGFTCCFNSGWVSLLWCHPSISSRPNTIS